MAAEGENQYFELVYKNSDGKFRTSTKIYELDNKDLDKTYYFIKLEQIYLTNIAFPIDISTEYLKFAVLKPETKQYCRHSIEKIYEIDFLKDKFQLSQTETISSYYQFCECLNICIGKAIETIKRDNDIKSIKYPYFEIYENKLNFIQLNEEINAQARNPDEHLLGFDKTLYILIGKYFNCDYGVNKDKNEIFYTVNNEFRVDGKEVFASHLSESFFYPDRTIYIETSRASNPKFDKTELGYTKREIHFRNNQDIVTLNQYLLLGTWETIQHSKNHYLRLTLDIDPEFIPMKDMDIVITNVLIKFHDIHDNISLFNASPGSIYSETEYNEMTFRKFINLNAENVHINNDPVETQLKSIRNHLSSQFPLVEAQDNNNIYYLLKNIHDIVNQSQLITPYGPTMAPPGNKKIKLNIN